MCASEALFLVVIVLVADGKQESRFRHTLTVLHSVYTKTMFIRRKKDVSRAVTVVKRHTIRK